ncbi:MAG: ParA family protein [bacterium]|nr:ParA family protein [bacterium]
MKKNDIILQIEQNFKAADGKLDELRVHPDPFSGWWIAVVSPSFEGKSRKERKAKTLAGLEDLQIEWLELITPGEKELGGPLPGDIELEDLPLWPEALAQGAHFESGKESLRLLSDIDEDIPLPVVASFYSLRGGVGRSTALAYTAYLLASAGRKVVCVDMDLEAPGLTALFGKEREIGDGMGLVHLLIAIDQGEKPDITKHLLRVSETYDLYCLPAGKINANYARILRFIDPESWYRVDRNPLRELMDALSENLPFKPDVILLDARTGITQLSGPVLFDLSDISINVFFPHPQAETGTRALVKALLAAKTRRDFAPEIRFLVSPIPSSRAPEVAQRYKKRAFEWISDWISPWKDNPLVNVDFLESDITHLVSYREVIATSDQILSDEDIWHNYRQLAEWVERFLPTAGEKNIPENLPSQKSNILENFKFSTGMAEQQRDLLDTFVETDIVRKALSPEMPLVLGRKGTGKTAVFRRLSEDKNLESIIITSPEKLAEQHKLSLNAHGFKEIEKILKKTESNWREFWTIYICLVSYYSQSKKGKETPRPAETRISELLENKPETELQLVDLIEKITSVERYGLIANDWLLQLESCAKVNTLLLFDGLDTGFGSEDSDRARRKNALEGLFVFLTGSGNRLKNFKIKIMLREDIWKSLKFENKSHLFGRSQSLRWNDQVSFLKVIMKQANRNKFFIDLLGQKRFPSKIEDWGEQDVITAWNLLVGERMKGGKTAFTRNWVWNRLADGNKDHSPRYLLQLLHEAVKWEKKELTKNPYERSIIRPRGLINVLSDVSEQALDALKNEEFPELTTLMDNLTKIARTPINASDLGPASDFINLAMEVGLLGIYEGSEEKVERYMVPEIFRYALRMTRKGQA